MVFTRTKEGTNVKRFCFANSLENSTKKSIFCCCKWCNCARMQVHSIANETLGSNQKLYANKLNATFI